MIIIATISNCLVAIITEREREREKKESGQTDE